jgi:lipoate-protein ligase A
MIYLESSSTDPYYNLALEEYVFEQMDQDEEYFMLWQNDNTIVVGRYQNTIEEINKQYVDEHGIRVARRLSGGGAVYHDKGNLNFTFIVDAKDHGFDFKTFVIPVVRALEKLGVTAEFNGRNDITIDGQKFSGNSQYIKHGRLLHHGCIMLDSNLENVADALNVREVKFESKSVKSVRSRVTTINAHAPQPITMQVFKETLRQCIFENDKIEKRVLSEEEQAAVARMREEKYATWQWNYGNSPAYSVRREKKYAAGLVTAYLQVKEGRIQAIKFYGDFFGNGEISELEAAMIGLKLDDQLEEALEKRNVSYYINGITAKEITQLLN